jgi:hypothetical protein
MSIVPSTRPLVSVYHVGWCLTTTDHTSSQAVQSGSFYMLFWEFSRLISIRVLDSLPEFVHNV